MSTFPDSSALAAAELDIDVDPAAVADANDLRDAAGGIDGPGADDTGTDDSAIGRLELPLEADPADVVEQDAAVPYDDEER